MGEKKSGFRDGIFILRRMEKEAMRTLSAVIVKEENAYIARCPEVGTVSQGKTVRQALKNLKEATELYLEECPIKSASKPILAKFEVVGHASPA